MIVQCGARRSGNFLLWKMLNRMLGREADYESFLGAVRELAPPLGYTHALPRDVTPGIYLVRDGRDAVHSLLRFVVTPEYRRRHPDCTREAVSELLALPGFFERRVVHWRDHVRSYLDDPRDWYRVRYEDLSGDDKPDVLRGLAERFGLDLDDRLLQRICAETTVESCRRAAPGHVHAGRNGGHVDLFDAELRERFDRIAGEELRALGYA